MIRHRDHIIAGLVERVQALPAPIDSTNAAVTSKMAPSSDHTGEQVSAVTMAHHEPWLRRWLRRVRGG